MLQPNQSAVVQMGKDGGDRAASALLPPGQFGSPSAWLKVLEQDLVHAVAGRIDFQQNFAKVGLAYCLVSHKNCLLRLLSNRDVGAALVAALPADSGTHKECPYVF